MPNANRWFIASTVCFTRGASISKGEFKQMRAKNEANGAPAPLRLHALMKESTSIELKNLVANTAASHIAPVEIIAHKS